MGGMGESNDVGRTSTPAHEKIVDSGNHGPDDLGMSTTQESNTATLPAPSETRPSPRSNTQPPYAVVLHNDDVNGFDFVVRSLRKVFGYDMTKAVWLTLKAHTSGRSHVWTGHKELAELKAEQMTSCGADPVMKNKGALPLRVAIEPLPSEQ